MSRWVITTCLPARALRLLLFRANATICGSMSPTDTGQSGARIPRVGIPWRTSAEEEEATISGKRGKTQDYINAVARAGAESVLVPLQDEQARNRLIPTLDGFVLPGSPADVEPRRYGSLNRGLSAPPDSAREETDRAILRHAFAVKKPVLAICYGCQLLNVYLGGTPGRSDPSRHFAVRKPPLHACRGNASGHQQLASPGDSGARQEFARYFARLGRDHRGRRVDGRFQLGHRRAMASRAHARRRVFRAIVSCVCCRCRKHARGGRSQDVARPVSLFAFPSGVP